MASGAPACGGRELRWALPALVALGALLRFSTLGVQHFWLDEAVTQGLVQLDLHDMLSTLPESESTPPLYYVVARGWALVFGSGEVGLRSLSALAGTLTIPVAGAVGATLASRRIGLILAALAAVSPALVWYSQEARSYALLVLLCALSLLFMARALRGGGRALAWWALTAMLALLTHYFAGFLIAGEAAWLLAVAPDRRHAALAMVPVGLVGLALAPLAAEQSEQNNLAFIDSTSLPTRFLDGAELMLAGPTGDRVGFPAVAVLAALVMAALVLLVRDGRLERRAVLVPASLALAATAPPVLLALAGADYVLARNLLLAWLPLAVLVALGRPAIAGALAVASLAVVVAVPLDRDLQREAITAALAPGGLDADGQRILPRVTYQVGGTPRRPRCPEGYVADSRGRALLAGGGDDRIVSAYVICVRPRD